MENMEKKKKISFNKVIALCAVLLLMLTLAPISYAFFTSSVTGNENASDSIVQSGTMRLVFTDGQVIGTTTNWIPGSSVTKSFTIENTGTLETSYSVFLEDVVNSFADKTDLVYTITGTTNGSNAAYSNNSETKAPSRNKKIIDNITISSGETHSYTITLTFLNKNENQNDNMNKSFEGKLQVYDTHNEPEIAPVSFATSSWNDIIAAYDEDDTLQLQTDMENGVTRNVDLGSLGIHQVRIANLTKCSSVSTTSKTACGLVIEFADIITRRMMNSNSTNAGGWQSSEMRTYVNNNIYNLIPSELKNYIIDTTVVSGHGPIDSSNFTTTDKLYLLSSREVWNYINAYDSASGDGITRQLDYYESIEATTDNCSGVIKKYDNSEIYWWLRSANSTIDISFFTAIDDGRWSNNNSANNNGVSPAFRLAQ